MRRLARASHLATDNRPDAARAPKAKLCLKFEVVMTEAQRAAKQAQLADLRRKRAKRKDEPGFAANVAELEQRIAQLEAELAG